MEIVMIVSILAIIAVTTAVCVKRNKELLASGKIIKRQMDFWEYAEYFLTDVSYEALRRVLLGTDLRDCAVSVTPEVNGQAQILFRCKHGWNAVIRWQGGRQGKNAYMFHFTAWRTGRYHIPCGLNQMNMLMTRLERLFLSMDPNTAVENRRLKVKTKTSFI